MSNQDHGRIKMKNTKSRTRKKGDEGERFVADLLQKLGFITEIHPRTMHPVRTPEGKMLYVSRDNDYHNAFDIKAEGPGVMLYIQVKFLGSNTHRRGEKSQIDRNYPHSFPYQRIQIWYITKEWVKRQGERRHKELKIKAVEERTGFDTIHGTWSRIDPDQLLEDLVVCPPK